MQDDAKTYTSPQLLSPDNHSLILVDQQYLVLITMHSHEVTQVVEAMTLLAKGAKLFGVRTLLTTAHSETQKLVQQVQDVFPDHLPIERTGLDAFEDERVVAWVKEGGPQKACHHWPVDREVHDNDYAFGATRWLRGLHHHRRRRWREQGNPRYGGAADGSGRRDPANDGAVSQGDAA
jgi:hypothetical protein